MRKQLAAERAAEEAKKKAEDALLGKAQTSGKPGELVYPLDACIRFAL